MSIGILGRVLLIINPDFDLVVRVGNPKSGFIGLLKKVARVGKIGKVGRVGFYAAPISLSGIVVYTVVDEEMPQSQQDCAIRLQ